MLHVVASAFTRQRGAENEKTTTLVNEIVWGTVVVVVGRVRGVRVQWHNRFGFIFFNETKGHGGKKYNIILFIQTI